MKRLVVNADDFGFTADVNEGIVEAHRNGILTATTLMANGDAFDDAARLAADNPSLDVGCHLVLVGGRSLLAPHETLPASVPELLAAIVSGRIRIYDELAAQVRKIIGAGIAPTHIDTHKNTHLAPPVLDAVARIAEEFGGLDAAFVIRLGQDGLPGRDASEDGDAGCAERRRGADAARDAPAALEVAALHEDVEVVADAVGGGDPELAADLADRRWESVLSREPLDEPENRARSFVQHGLRSSLTVGRPTCTTAVWCTRVHFVKGLFFRQV